MSALSRAGFSGYNALEVQRTRKTELFEPNSQEAKLQVQGRRFKAVP